MNKSFSFKFDKPGTHHFTCTTYLRVTGIIDATGLEHSRVADWSVRFIVHGSSEEKTVEQTQFIPILFTTIVSADLLVQPELFKIKNLHRTGCGPMVIADHSAEALSALNG